jgi:hypothetical protein
MAAQLLAVGLGLEIVGGLMANYSQARAEFQNAKFYERQAQFTQFAGRRQEFLARRNYAYLKGQQLGTVAAQGGAFTGSVNAIIADTLANEIEEIEAIRVQTGLETDLARMRAAQARSTGTLLTSPVYNAVQIGGSIVGSGLIKG